MPDFCQEISWRYLKCRWKIKKKNVILLSDMHSCNAGQFEMSTVFFVQTQKGTYDIEARVMSIGDDLLVAISGGEKPHIGAVSVAQPRPSLKDAAKMSASASVFCMLGHKEDNLAKDVSEILSASLNKAVVVTAGIHWDNLNDDGIEIVNQNSRLLVELILDKLKQAGG